MADLTYSRTYATSEKVRLQCDGYRGDYKSVSWSNSSYTTSGDASITGSYCDVVITLPKVTVTWMNSSGGATYKFYCVLHTANGTSYTSSKITKSWEWEDTKTLKFTIPSVLGAWTSFEIWGQNYIMSYKDTEYPYVYWFENHSGTVTVEYTKSTGVTTSAFVRVGDTWKQAIPYRWQSLPIGYGYPEDAMTSNSSQGCIASASSTYSDNFPAYKLFDFDEETRWASSENATGPWIQLQMPKALYNIEVTLTNRTGGTSYGPKSGFIYGTNDGDADGLVEIGSYSDRDGATEGYESTIICTNTDTAYNTVRVKITTWNGSAQANLSEIYISGTDVPTGGGWLPASPAVWNNGWK